MEEHVHPHEPHPTPPATCACAQPIPVERAERKGVVETYCGRCGLPLTIRWR